MRNFKDSKKETNAGSATLLCIRHASANDTVEIERMVADFATGHPAECHPRDSDALRDAYFGERPVAHLLVAERRGEIVGMVQWRLIYDMFWGMFGAQAEWLYVKPHCRRSGIVVALVARVCCEASEAGARFVQGGGGDGPSRLYERVAIDHIAVPPDHGIELTDQTVTTLAYARLAPVRPLAHVRLQASMETDAGLSSRGRFRFESDMGRRQV